MDLLLQGVQTHVPVCVEADLELCHELVCATNLFAPFATQCRTNLFANKFVPHWVACHMPPPSLRCKILRDTNRGQQWCLLRIPHTYSELCAYVNVHIHAYTYTYTYILRRPRMLRTRTLSGLYVYVYVYVYMCMCSAYVYTI